MFSVFFAYRILDKEGLFIVMLMMIGITILSSFKIVGLFNIDINFGIIPYVTILSIYYIILEKYNKKDKINFIKLCIIGCLFISVILFIGSLYQNSVNDVLGVNLKILFIDNYRVLIAILVILIGNILATEKVFNFIKFESNKMLDRSLAGALLLVIDSLVFTLISYVGILEVRALVNLFFINYLAKLIIMIIYTPLVEYIIKSKKVES